MKFDFTAFHHPSIFITRFFFFFRPLAALPLLDGSVLDRTELPDKLRGRSNMFDRFKLGDRVGSMLIMADCIDVLRLLRPRSGTVKSSRDVVGDNAIALDESKLDASSISLGEPVLPPSTGLRDGDAN